VFADGISQTGRVLREFLYQGLNRGEDGGTVFDGVPANIASARRGEFNRRYAQPAVADDAGVRAALRPGFAADPAA
jgi:hypothetical protein